MRPELNCQALMYLKQNNSSYSDIGITLENIRNDLLSLSENSDNNQEFDKADPLEKDKNRLDLHRFKSQETMFVANMTTAEEISIAPGEGKEPTSILNDKYCEEFTFPCLFPKGKFDYKVKRKIKLSPVKYFNQRLLNYTQIFASDPDYIVFVLSVTQQLKLQSQINIAMKKVCSGHLTAGVLSQNFSEKVKSFIVNNEAYHFMNIIKGTPAYWKRFLHEVLAIVKLGLPTFFMTLSCADLRWNELISVTAKLNGENLEEDDINNMDFFDRCRYLNLNPVVLVQHFQYRVEVFFKVIIIVDSPLGKVNYHAIRVEFQV